MSVELYALGCVLASAFLKLVHRATMKQGVSRTSVLIFYNVAGGMLLIPAISPPQLLSISSAAWLLLLLASTLWLICDSLNLEALKHLSAADSDIFNTLRIVLLALIGVILFKDSLSASAILGIMIIIGAMLLNVDFSVLEFNKGTALALTATVFAAFAITIDKILLSMIEPALVVFFGFLIPGILLALRRPAEVRHVLPCLRSIGAPLLIAPILGVIRYHCMVHAYSLGQLSSVTMILQATVFLVFLLELVVMKEKSRLHRRCCSSLGCVVGAVLVCTFDSSG